MNTYILELLKIERVLRIIFHTPLKVDIWETKE